MDSGLPGPGNSTGVGCHFFLQSIFLTQGSNPVFWLAGRFFTTDQTREAVSDNYMKKIHISLVIQKHGRLEIREVNALTESTQENWQSLEGLSSLLSN